MLPWGKSVDDDEARWLRRALAESADGMGHLKVGLLATLQREPPH